jgi:hypothetical protein
MARAWTVNILLAAAAGVFAGVLAAFTCLVIFKIGGVFAGIAGPPPANHTKAALGVALAFVLAALAGAGGGAIAALVQSPWAKAFWMLTALPLGVVVGIVVGFGFLLAVFDALGG